MSLVRLFLSVICLSVVLLVSGPQELFGAPAKKSNDPLKTNTEKTKAASLGINNVADKRILYDEAYTRTDSFGNPVDDVRLVKSRNLSEIIPTKQCAVDRRVSGDFEHYSIEYKVDKSSDIKTIRNIFDDVRVAFSIKCKKGDDDCFLTSEPKYKYEVKSRSIAEDLNRVFSAVVVQNIDVKDWLQKNSSSSVPRIVTATLRTGKICSGEDYKKIRNFLPDLHIEAPIDSDVVLSKDEDVIRFLDGSRRKNLTVARESFGELHYSLKSTYARNIEGYSLGEVVSDNSMMFFDLTSKRSNVTYRHILNTGCNRKYYYIESIGLDKIVIDRFLGRNINGLETRAGSRSGQPVLVMEYVDDADNPYKHIGGEAPGLVYYYTKEIDDMIDTMNLNKLK